jgi:nudix-type nucleoside diphosphatase (YffH/AdpP family)
MKKVEIKQIKRVYDDFFKVDEALVRYEKYDGQMSEIVKRFSFERGDAVAVLIYNPDTQKVILTEQFRYPIYAGSGGWIVEVVAGVLEEGEMPEDTVRREMVEEVGYKANELIPISTFYPSPGGSSERIYLYYAEVNGTLKVNDGGGLDSEHEDIRVIEYSLPEVWQALDTAQFHDAKTIIALMWLRGKK